jgi:hypothetical protein
MAQNVWKVPKTPRTISKFERYAALRENWDFSLKFLDFMSETCKGHLSKNIETVAIAGSFGRLEGSSESDADYIMVVRDPKAPTIAKDKGVIRDAIEAFGVTPPNKSGVFTKPRSASQLITPIGTADEDVDLLGKRMLLLLESRPIYGIEQFQLLLKGIFERYSEYVADDPDKEFAFLANDLMRYFRFICVNYQANFWRQNEGWALRNLKLRHSRIVMYSGLLFLIGEASKQGGEAKIDCVFGNLNLTPLERIGLVYKRNGDGGFFRVLGLYNVFLAHLSDANWRKQLKDLEYPNRYTVPAFAEMKANSDAFIAEFVRFLLARRGQWSDRFFEYVFF